MFLFAGGKTGDKPKPGRKSIKNLFYIIVLSFIFVVLHRNGSVFLILEIQIKRESGVNPGQSRCCEAPFIS